MILALSIVCLVASAVCFVAEQGWLRGVAAQWRRMPHGQLAALLLLLSWGTLYGGSKTMPSGRTVLARFVTALRSGVLLDDSGRIGATAVLAATQAFDRETAAIVAAATNVVAAADSAFAAAAFALTNRNLSVAYIAADLPRAEPHSHTNHNLAATIERVGCDGGTNLLAWVWFSEEPAVGPVVSFDASTQDGVWTRLTSVTNSYPDTLDINGVPCVEYRFEVPAGMRGVVFRPEYEVGFGGSREADYLLVPAGGVLVETNAVPLLPYTGWDAACGGAFSNLAVRYSGGVAVEAVAVGTNYTGRAGEVYL